MTLELRAELSEFRQHERQYRQFAVFVVHGEMEALRQQRPHHHSHAVLAGIALRARLNIEGFGFGPIRKLRVEVLRLVADDFVGESDVGDEREASGGEIPTVADVYVSR